jgi:dihydrofolate synthase/folylpolyglutamate synthase
MVEKKRAFLEKLSMHRDFGVKPGLENITELCGRLGNPHLKVPSIHVAGTNGKGSVCSIISTILDYAGKKVGLYTSPHIFKYTEGIQINGVQISDENFAKYVFEISKIAQDNQIDLIYPHF